MLVINNSCSSWAENLTSFSVMCALAGISGARWGLCVHGIEGAAAVS